METLIMCPLCMTPGFTVRGLQAHRCRANERLPLGPEQIERAVKAAGGALPEPAKVALPVPETERSVGSVGSVQSDGSDGSDSLEGDETTEDATEDDGLAFIADCQIHPRLGNAGTTPALVAFLTRKGKDDGKQREKCKERCKELEAEFHALVEDIKANGVREPIKAVLDKDTGVWLVVDGRHRLAAAKEAGHVMIPVSEIPESAVDGVILSSLAFRRHLSKGAVAWQAVKLNPETALGGTIRNTMNLPNRTECGLAESTVSEGSVPALAEKIGIATRTVEQACAIYRLLEAPELKLIKPDAEASIWAGAGLGGMEGFLKAELDRIRSGKLPNTNAGKADRDSAIWRTWTDFCDKRAATLGETWLALGADQKETALAKLCGAVAEWPEEVIQAAVELWQERGVI